MGENYQRIMQTKIKEGNTGKPRPPLFGHLRKAPRFSVFKRPTNLGSSGFVSSNLSAAGLCMTAAGVELSEKPLQPAAQYLQSSLTMFWV